MDTDITPSLLEGQAPLTIGTMDIHQNLPIEILQQRTPGPVAGANRGK